MYTVDIPKTLAIESEGFSFMKKKDIKTATKSEIIDYLLNDYEKQNLVQPKYRSWFAKRFYDLNLELVDKLAKEATIRGENKGAYFCASVKAKYEEL